MAKVAREMVERTGVNVDQLVELLVKNPAAELTTFYYYTILRVNLIGLEGEGIKEIAETARIEDRNHFEALVPRIYELGGKLPEDMKVFHDISACPPARLPQNPRDIKAMLTVLVEAERCAVRGYTHICNLTAGKDHRTYDLSLAILNEEVEHEAWFSEFLEEGPSGHYLRRGETSPWVGKAGRREARKNSRLPNVLQPSATTPVRCKSVASPGRNSPDIPARMVRRHSSRIKDGCMTYLEASCGSMEGIKRFTTRGAT